MTELEWQRQRADHNEKVAWRLWRIILVLAAIVTALIAMRWF